MKCPFLRETEVKYCRQSASRKIAVRGPAISSERCSSSEYVDCRIFRDSQSESAPAGCCPLLERALAQYCAAAPVTKLIPYSEVLLSRCGNGGYRYCELFATFMQVPAADAAAMVDGVAVPPHLAFMPNHMWIDTTVEGSYYIGIDALLAQALGAVEALTFVSTSGTQRPTAVATVRGTDFPIVFPRPLLIKNANLYLRANPSKLLSDPYATGWLFEVGDPPGPPTLGDLRNVMRGAEAINWMRGEVDRVSRFVHELAGAGGMANDGGQFAPDLMANLEREPALRLFNEFFSPYREWTR
ncbi:MAG: hypothetical protein IT160_19915 [Bryobacterales bacterium]|nr:hypothetical protein [Bryobacterales bacterium]